MAMPVGVELCRFGDAGVAPLQQLVWMLGGRCGLTWLRCFSVEALDAGVDALVWLGQAGFMQPARHPLTLQSEWLFTEEHVRQVGCTAWSVLKPAAASSRGGAMGDVAGLGQQRCWSFNRLFAGWLQLRRHSWHGCTPLKHSPMHSMAGLTGTYQCPLDLLPRNPFRFPTRQLERWWLGCWPRRCPGAR